MLLSLLVPGFGLVRAGRILRGLAWFIALQIIGVLVILLAIWRSIPLWGVFAGLIVALGCQLAMWADSFRPGRLTIRLWLAFGVAVLALLFLPPAPFLFAHAFTIPTDGMAPTLRGQSNGTVDRIIADRLCYVFSPPQRGDLVVFRTTGMTRIQEDTFYVKRLVGLPGEKIEIRGEHVFADGRQLGVRDGIPDIAYTLAPGLQFMAGSGTYDVPRDAYFMLGDNSGHSSDSRMWGCVPRANVYGRVARIYYPFSRASIPR